MVTHNLIIDGIVSKIYAEFGDGYEIYTENNKQGLQEPCFSVVCLKSTIKKLLGERYFRKGIFAIYYFAESIDEANKECLDVNERLLDILELITVDGDSIRGKNMESEILDGVLAFYVNYEVFVKRENILEEPMEFLNQEITAY